MVNIISIGIKKDQNSDVVIECATNDAKNVYQVFAKAIDYGFSSYNSISITDINVDTFRKLIKSLKDSVSFNDIFVIYFSGHGSINPKGIESLSLHFVDEKLDLVSIVNELYQINGKVLLILDTCHSEHAIKLTNIFDSFAKSNIFVLSSADFLSKARFDCTGSFFTSTLCEAIMKMSKKGEEISLLSIKDYFFEYNTDIFIGMATGSTNLILKESYDFNEFPDFHNRFLAMLDSFEYKTREMMWYSLENFPSKAYVDIICDYLSKEVYEASWLVRRAIGSVLANLNEYYDERITNLFNKNIRSQNWMKLIILLIAKRYDLNEHLVSLEQIICDHTLNMDVVWLANLYYFDCDNISYNKVFQSKLSESEWGILEIFTLISNEHSIEESFSIVQNYISDGSMLEKVKLDISLKERYEYTNSYNALKDNKIVKLLYNKEKRGRSPIKSKNKWVYSAIYGNWRDRINLNIKDYFENMPKDKIKEELMDLSLIPQYQMKMAIFDFFSHEEHLFEEYYNSLIWGIKDIHPWVVREAIKAFNNYPDIVKRELPYMDTDKYLYPGYLDLLIDLNIVCPSINIKNILNLEKLSKSELIALAKNRISIMK